MTQQKIPAVYMRGGTSKGVFFHARDLPAEAVLREQTLLRVIGSPDGYGKHIDGMGGGTSSTSKVVIISKSTRPDCDVDYLFGAVAIDKPVIDWSGNCGNLTASVGPFAISEGLVEAPADGTGTVRIWQSNVGKRIVAKVPMRAGEVLEDGEFMLDGVAFPAAEIKLEFIDPGADTTDSGMLPTGNACDSLSVPGFGQIEVTMINAGNPTIFMDASALQLLGTELQPEINASAALLERAEAIRAAATVRMGLADSAEQATRERPHTPKLAFVAPARNYTASNGRVVESVNIDLLARIFSMGLLHHAMTGTGAVALAAAAAIPGTVVNRLLSGSDRQSICFGHPSGMLRVGAQAQRTGDDWVVNKVLISRSSRRLMEGFVRVPANTVEIG